MSSDNIQKQLDNIRISYIESLADKKDAIQVLWQELQVNWQPEAYEKLYIIVHSLAGSAGTFDLPDITDKARAVVELFKENKTAKKTLSDRLINQTDTLLTQLLNAMISAK